MPARKNQDVAFDHAHAIHCLICPGSNLVRRFPARTAVAEQLPLWTHGMNFRRPEAFILAVVPFDQIAIDFGYSAEAG